MLVEDVVEECSKGKATAEAEGEALTQGSSMVLRRPLNATFNVTTIRHWAM